VSAPTSQAVLDVLMRLQQAGTVNGWDIYNLPHIGAFNAAQQLVAHEAFTWLDENVPGWGDYQLGSMTYLSFFYRRHGIERHLTALAIKGLLERDPTVAIHATNPVDKGWPT